MTEAILFCPKCRAEMTSHQLGEIMIFQCDFCRGVFVSEQGLFRLIDCQGPEVPVLATNPQHNGVTRGPYEGRHRHG
ncbi:zf-TFIIB domain-containing protein [Actinocorallia longicatena]|uniref:Transcription factor zinc-finger domain-containing protein n=1 Tax=Actinocorallia longicatena TaxID=111803 RepID=A0ABP6QJR8_9ACTN